MRGHCEIRLHNKETHTYKKIDADNLVTNAWKYAMNGLIMTRQNATSYLPVAETLLGGLMLFDGPLTESADNIAFPSEAHLAGYGDRESDTSDPMRGTYNSLESGRTDQGYTLTWDFSTAQCNEQIGCVSLANSEIVNRLKLGLQPAGSNFRLHSPLYHDGEYMYALDVSSAGTLWINRWMRPYNVSVHTRPDYSDDALGPYKTIDVSSDFTEAWSTERWAYDEPGYITTYGRDWSGSSGSYVTDLWYAKVRTSDWEYIPKQTIRIDQFPSIRLETVISAGGYFYLKDYYSARAKFYRFDPSNTADVREITFDEKYVYTGASGRVHTGVIVVLLRDTTSIYGDSDPRSYANAYIYPDGVTKLVKSDMTSTYAPGIGFSERLISDTNMPTYSSSVYLGTICNLSSPVTKTSATTMKVIYTLTDV